MSHSCHFCGQEITKDNVLFVYTGDRADYHVDNRRYQFLKDCSENYPFEAEGKFRSIYFQCKEPNLIVTNPNNDTGFPIELRVRLSNGLTPEQLEKLERPSYMQEASDPNQMSFEQYNPTERVIQLRTRACPHCHCCIPDGFEIYPTYNVCLFGGRAAGKTAYLIALLQQLNKQLQASNLGVVSFLEESRVYFEPQMEFYAQSGLTSPTDTHSGLFPLVLEYTNLNKNPPLNCFIALYDIAGEGLNDANYLANHSGLQCAETLMLMLDPNMLCSGEYFHATRAQGFAYDEEMPDQGMEHDNLNAHDYCDMSLDDFLADAYKISVHLKLEHIIAVVTKMDQPLNIDGGLFAASQNILKENNVIECHNGHVDRNTLNKVSEQIKSFINSKLSTASITADISKRIVNAFGANTKPPLMLGVSTYTKVRQESSRAVFEHMYSNEAPKHRIIEPFLAILLLADIVHQNTTVPIQLEPEPKPKRQRRGFFSRR